MVCCRRGRKYPKDFWFNYTFKGLALCTHVVQTLLAAGFANGKLQYEKARVRLNEGILQDFKFTAYWKDPATGKSTKCLKLAPFLTVPKLTGMIKTWIIDPRYEDVKFYGIEFTRDLAQIKVRLCLSASLPVFVI